MIDSIEHQPSTSPKDVFVTYAWDKENPDHQSYVEGFVNLLRQEGIHADMDLRRSQQESAIDFDKMMYQGITDYKKVIIFMSEAYQKKATAFKDGVGTEYQLVIKDIDTNPNKYILVSTYGRADIVVPIAFRKREITALSNPIKKSQLNAVKAKILGIQTRHFVDVAETIEMIAVTKPNILVMVDDTTDDGNLSSIEEPNANKSLKTSRLLRQIDAVLDNKPLMVNHLIGEFLNAFISELKTLSVNFEGAHTHDDYGELVYKKVSDYTPLRDELIIFLDKISKSGVDYDTDKFISFLEKLLPLNDGSYKSDHYTFIIHELFILIAAILLKNENYKQLSDLFYTTYYYTSTYGKAEKSFVEFRHHSASVETYMQKHSGGRLITGAGKAIVTRLPHELTKQDVVKADLLAFYISELKGDTIIGRWLPLTFIYKDNSYREFYERLKLTRFFVKVKVLFDCDTADDLRNELITIQKNSANDYGYHFLDSGEVIPPIYKIIDPDTIASKR